LTSLNDHLPLDRENVMLGPGHKFNSTAAGYGDTSSTNAALPMSTMSRKGSTTSHGTKRSAFSPEDDDLDGDGEGRRNPKRSKSGSDSIELGQRFACPYRKHNPRKYSVQDWRICALTHHKTIARVKYFILAVCPKLLLTTIGNTYIVTTLSINVSAAKRYSNQRRSSIVTSKLWRPVS
jgi:hypothetical protein